MTHFIRVTSQPEPSSRNEAVPSRTAPFPGDPPAVEPCSSAHLPCTPPAHFPWSPSTCRRIRSLLKKVGGVPTRGRAPAPKCRLAPLCPHAAHPLIPGIPGIIPGIPPQNPRHSTNSTPSINSTPPPAPSISKTGGGTKPPPFGLPLQPVPPARHRHSKRGGVPQPRPASHPIHAAHWPKIASSPPDSTFPRPFSKKQGGGVPPAGALPFS